MVLDRTRVPGMKRSFWMTQLYRILAMSRFTLRLNKVQENNAQKREREKNVINFFLIFFL